MEEETGQTTIKVSLKDGSFEVSGSEEFVKVQLPHLEKLVLDFCKKIQEKPVRKEVTGEIGQPQEDLGEQKDELADVFELVDDKVTLIIEAMPGNTKKDKMINAALLYIYGTNRFLKSTEVPKKEILDICDQYGCKDSSNFALHVKKAKSFLIMRGSKIRITKPGIKKAKKIINDLGKEKGKKDS